MFRLHRLLCFSLLFCLVSVKINAQVDRARIIAAYLNNFARYTTWPDENLMDSFRISVISEDIEIRKEFLQFSKTRKIKNKPVHITLSSSFSANARAHLILLPRDKSELLLTIYNTIENKPVLLVSEEYPDKHNIMINIAETPQNQIVFEINNANVINQHLTVDPEILLAGGTEIDVASLYRKSQVNLRNMEKQMDRMKDSVSILNHDIQRSIFQVNLQKAEIEQQKSLLENRNQELSKLQYIIHSQEAVLSSQTDSINQKNLILNKQQKAIHNQWQEAEKLEKILTSRQLQIQDLNWEITNKNTILGYQSDTIVRQRQILGLMITIGVLIVFLIIAIFRSYRTNKLKNAILIEQKAEIEEKLAELKRLNLQLHTADQYKSIFLASMSHELRTPLNSIIGYTGILLMGMTGKLNDEQNKQLAKVKNNAKHLLSLINDILDISKIEAGRVEMNCEEFRLHDLIREVEDSVQPKVTEKEMKLITDIKGDIILFTDLRRLKQIVLNLVSNAINYSHSGDIIITAEKIPDKKIRLSVKDSGIGISEAEIARLFQPFQQIESSLTKKNKGSGLGLYISRKLVNLLEGEIFVKSELGKGSDFYIELPVRFR